MSSIPGEDFQEMPSTLDNGPVEVELEAGPRAERPNFLTATRFTDFDLPPEILEGLDKAGFEYCTPIQAQAIPVALSGLDIAGQAQTGTGKTTAFLVPLMNRLLSNKPLEAGVPRAIIVTPTRELALQIHEDALVLAGGTTLRQVLVIGGIDYKEQADLLSSGPEIVICTPGRIIDYLQQGVFKTKGIEVAVVDEADRLLDMGFIKDLKYLLGKLPPFTHRQTMLFSATLDDRVLELTYQYMNPPQFITAEPDKDTKINIVQELYHVGRDEKLPLLMGLLRREPHQRVIIFVNTKSGVEWLAKKLTLNGFQAEGITGDLPQPKRLKLMEAFKENRLQILVATDVASRGIHVDDVSHVYNYDLPQDAENYVHRIGRTARAGHAGKAVSFGCEDYVFHLEAIENLLGEKIPVFWAEQEWLQEDQAGEVRVRDRRGGDRDRDRQKGSGRGGRGDRGDRAEGGGRAPRGAAKSQRPGGIFGLSPRLPGKAEDDTRQLLNWSPAGAEERPEPVVEAAVESVEAIAVEAETAAEAQGPGREGGRNDRRRKRRRGRRGREAGGEPVILETTLTSPEQAPSETPVVFEPVDATPTVDRVVEARPVETAVTAPDGGAAEAGAAPRKSAARKHRRPSAQKPPRVAAGGEEASTAPPVAEAAAAPAGPKEKPAPKPRRSAAKKAEAEAPAAEASAPKASVPKAKAAPAEKKPRRSTAKKAEAEAPAAEASASKAKAVPAEKKSRRSTAKKAEAETPAAEASAPKAKAAPAEKKPRRSTAKKAEAAPAEAEAPAAKKAPAPAKKAARPTREKAGSKKSGPEENG